MKLAKVLLATMALLFVLSACASEVPRTTTPPTLMATNTPTPRAEPTITPTPVPTLVPTPVPTQTPIPVPTQTPIPVPTQTPIPVPTPTATPARTLTPKPLERTPLPERDNSEPPHVFVGSVTIDGGPAPDGTEVTVWLVEFDAPIGTGITSSGIYTALANQHGAKSFGGRALIFKVNGEDSGETFVWKKGEATMLDLSLN